MTVGIYAITHIATGRQYVGQSADIEARWYLHKNALRRNKHVCTTLKDLWIADGESAFMFEILEEMPGSSVGQRRDRERFYIRQNEQTIGQTGLNMKGSPSWEMQNKIDQSRKLKDYWHRWKTGHL